MKQSLGSSNAKENLEDEQNKQLLKNKDFKGELTNVLKYCNRLLQAKDLVTDTSTDETSSMSIVMGEVICEEIINIFGNWQIVTKYDLILFDESDTEELYKEVC